MTEKLILSQIYQLPESLKLEVLHYVIFLTSNQGDRIFGRSKGRYKLAPDFDAPLEDFKEYM